MNGVAEWRAAEFARTQRKSVESPRGFFGILANAATHIGLTFADPEIGVPGGALCGSPRGGGSHMNMRVRKS